MFRNAAKRRTPLSRVVSIALLCLFIAAEAVAVVHSLDYEAHAGADPCKICISISGLDDVVSASAPVLVPPAAAARDAFPAGESVVFERIQRPNARAPPQAS
jgi:hypothetical protein